MFDYPIPLAQPRAEPRFAGKVYLLINRNSYSNTVMVAALAQDYHFATVLGEETADLGSTYGAMEQFTLSRTGIVVNFSQGPDRSSQRQYRSARGDPGHCHRYADAAGLF